MEETSIDNQIDELLAWHKPEIQHLGVTPDTGFLGSSSVDFLEGEVLPEQ